MMKMFLLKELSRGRKDAEDTDSEQGDETFQKRTPLMRSFTTMHQYRNRRIKNPKRVTAEYRAFVLDQLLRVHEGEHWDYTMAWGKYDFSRCRSIGRAAYILAEVVQLHEENKPEAACATAVQGLKACAQFAMDGGSWRTSWNLTTLRDPYAAPEFAGTESDMTIVGGFMKAQAELKEKVAVPKWQTPKGDDEDGDTPAMSGAAKARARKAAAAAERLKAAEKKP